MNCNISTKNGKDVVTKNDVENFYKKWYIFRFTSREVCEEILKEEETGAFLVRFSESNPGRFSVSYVKQKEKEEPVVHHYMLKADDTGNNKPLSDFLRSNSNWKTMLQFNALDGTITRKPKDEALSSFYTATKEKKSKGYEEDMNS